MSVATPLESPRDAEGPQLTVTSLGWFDPGPRAEPGSVAVLRDAVISVVAGLPGALRSFGQIRYVTGSCAFAAGGDCSHQTVNARRRCGDYCAW